ncbi:MAG TPA: ABC transporter substrate-binding protein [Thermotogota bacterium]|nr:ABC transporter substrate-binding protein [Thermotogota bacterium]HRW93381.1 ABC transporter substrate-binding protein [Thermotogota bacterium]
MKKVLTFVLLACVLVALSFGATTITVSGWPGNPTEEAGIKAVIDAFNASQDQIVAVWEPVPGDFRQMLITRLSAGTGPDIFYVDVNWFDEVAGKNLLLGLDMYIRRDGYDVEDFYASLIDGFSYRDRVYGFPKDFSTLALFYNKEMFDKAGVAYPNHEDSWNDFRVKLEELKAAGIETPLVIVPDVNRFLPLVYSFGGQFVDENLDSAIDDPKTVKALDYYVSLVQDGLAQEPASVGATWIGEAFGKGEVALAMSGPWSVGYLRDSFPQTWEKTAIAELPHGEKRSTMIYTVCYAINRGTPNKDAAWEVLKYLTGVEGQGLWAEKTGILASRQSLAVLDTDPTKTAFYLGAEYGSAWKVETPSGIFSEANTQINSVLKDLFYEETTLDEAVQFIKANYASWVEER